MSEEDWPWHCENCGAPLRPGEAVMHAAFGEVDEDGMPDTGDHCYVHQKCPGEEIPQLNKWRAVLTIAENRYKDENDCVDTGEMLNDLRAIAQLAKSVIEEATE